MSKNFVLIRVGIDIAKDDFKVCMMGLLADQQRKVIASSRFANRSQGFEDFWQWVEKHSKKYELEVGFLLEATGIYHENLAWFLYHKKKPIFIVLPNHAKAFFKSEGIKSKTDKIDARGLALMALSKAFKAWKPISPVLHHLRTQTRHHSNLQKELTRMRNQLHALEHSHQPDQEVLRQLKEMMKFLLEKIKEMKKSIEQLVKSDEKLYKRLCHLTTIYGVGLLSASVVVAETNGFALFSSQKQLVSYAGYDVVENQSGKQRGRTRISKQGNSHIRRILCMPAFNAVKVEGIFKDFYRRIFERTRLKMKAYTAVQRKLLCLMYTLWKKEEDFDPKKINFVEGQDAPLPEITLK